MTPRNLPGGQTWYFDARLFGKKYMPVYRSPLLSVLRSLKCTKFDFGWGSAPEPAGGAYSVSPDPLAGFKGPPRNVALMILTPPVRK